MSPTEMDQTVPGSIAEAGRQLRNGTSSALGLMRTLLARADVLDPLLGSFITRDAEGALATAARADEELAAGIDRGPLHGIPVGVKDIISVEGIDMTAQSDAMWPRFYGGQDAPAVQRLRDAGAVIVGTTTTMEFAIGMPDAARAFPLPRNPFDPARWAGGSSSGTASGVAAGFMLGGLGTDTGGSIRLPSAWCGITGFKPTFGTVPTSGVVPLGLSHDVVGPMGRTAHDCALLLVAMTGNAPDGPHGVPEGGRLTAQPPSSRPLRIGVPMGLIERSDCVPDVLDLFDRALAVLEGLGHRLVTVELPYFTPMQAANDVSKVVEAWSYHQENLRRHWDLYGVSTRTSLVRGASTSGGDYLQAQRVRHAGTTKLAELFSSVDAVAMPTHPAPAPAFGLSHQDLLGTVLTPYWSACGFPALSVPMGLTSDGLPVGLQLAAAAFRDSLVLQLGIAFQEHTSHHRALPDLEALRVRNANE